MLKEKSHQVFYPAGPKPGKRERGSLSNNSHHIIKKQSFQVKGLENVDFKLLKVTSHMLQ